MKKCIMIYVMMFITAPIMAQDKEKVLEKRAIDFHEALQSPERETWKKYISENYSARLITARGLDKIADMWTDVHSDFGDSKIVTNKFVNNVQEMIIKRNEDGQKASVLLTPEAAAPYKIDRVAIEVGEMNMGGGGGNGGQQVVVRGGPGPGPGGDLKEVKMNELLMAISSGGTALDKFLDGNVDKTDTQKFQQIKSSVSGIAKDFKSHEIIGMDISSAGAHCIIQSASSKKVKKISLKLNGDRISSLVVSDN